MSASLPPIGDQISEPSIVSRGTVSEGTVSEGSARVPPVVSRGVDRQLVMATLGKFVVCLGFRLPYVFLTPISKQLGTTIGHLGSLMALGELTGLLTGITGRSLDRGKFRFWLTMGSGSTIGGVAIMGAAATSQIRSSTLFALGFAITALGVATFTTAAHAWLGASVPYARRGWSMGRLETSWAFAVLIGAPIFGLVISLFNVSTMFAGLVFISTLSTWSVWKVFGQPHSAESASSSPNGSSPTNSGSASGDDASDQMGANHYSATIAASGSPEAKALLRRITAALLCSAAMSFGSICIFSVYGSWLTERFGLSIRAVGLFSVFVGLAELGASTLSSAKTDQWGKRRSVAMGSVVMLAGMVGIGIVPKITVLGVGVLVLMFLGFEFGYVSLLSVISEVGEHRKGTVLSIDHALSPLGRAGAAALATNLFDAHGIAPISIIAGAASIVAFAAIRLATRS
jgi:MFS transporter, DHA1 family, inner membrane transport protein